MIQGIWTWKEMKKEIATQGYYMLQRCMGCNLWIYLIQFLVQIKTPQIWQEKKTKGDKNFKFNKLHNSI